MRSALANHLRDNNEVVSDESDKHAFCKHAGKLDKLTGLAKVEPFSSLLDHTDFQFNAGNDALPAG